MLLSEVSIHAFIQEHSIRTENGELLEFHDHRYLYDIYADRTPNRVDEKAAQLGLTTREIICSLWEAKNIGMDEIYVLPTFQEVQDFSGGKTNRIIDNNPIFQQWVKDKDSVEQKRVGSATIYYRGSWNERQALMISADRLIMDEFDRANQAVLEQYESRLQHSKYGYKSIFSNPSLPGQGVDRFFQITDKKFWFVSPSCRHDFLFDEKCLNYERERFECPICGTEITDEDRRMGEWKATTQGQKDWSGYWIPLWVNPKVSAHRISEYKRTKSPQYFANFVAGLPYIGGEDTISSAQVLKNCVDEVNTQEDRIIIGVDPGNPWYFVCMNKQGVFYAEEMERAGVLVNGKPFNPIDRLRELLNMWKTAIVVMDQGGEQSPQRILKEEFKGRVFLAFYQKDTKSFEVVRWGEGDKWGEVRIDRNKMFQIMVEQLRDVGRIRFNGTKDDWLPVAEHFDHVYREIVITTSAPGKDDRGLYTPEYVWKRNGADHFCFIAGTKITTNRGEIPIEQVRVGDMVLTRKGYKRVYDALKRNREGVITAYFSNGAVFTGTPDHPVIHTSGKERLDSITRHAILYSCKNQKLLFTKGLLTGDIQIPQDEKQEFISSQMECFGQKGLRGFISRYGLMPLEKSLKGTSFIIKTAIRSITTFQTWCVNQELSINPTISLIGLENFLLDNEMQNILPKYDQNPMLGGVLKQERRGIKPMLLRALSYVNLKSLSALSAVLKVLHEAIRAVSFVPPDVVIVGSHENIAKKDVINLSVEDEHEYFANGILVSNCHCLLYAMVGLDRWANDKALIVKKETAFRPPTGSTITNQISAKRIMKRLYKDAEFS